MISGVRGPVIVPSNASLIRHRLPFTGSSGASSPASLVLLGAPTPGRPSGRASLPSLGRYRAELAIRSQARASSPAWVLGFVHPVPSGILRGDDRSSWVPGEPSCTHAPLFDRGGER